MPSPSGRLPKPNKDDFDEPVLDQDISLPPAPPPQQYSVIESQGELEGAARLLQSLDTANKNEQDILALTEAVRTLREELANAKKDISYQGKDITNNREGMRSLESRINGYEARVATIEAEIRGYGPRIESLERDRAGYMALLKQIGQLSRPRHGSLPESGQRDMPR